MTKMYRYTGSVEFSGAVEADSLVEAIRIIDGGLNDASHLVFEGEDEELRTSPIRIQRGRVAVEN